MHYLWLDSWILMSVFHDLQIYDGKDNAAHMLGAFTGSSMLGLTLISTSNHLWLEFYSDAEATGEGFKLVYSSKLLHHPYTLHTFCPPGLDLSNKEKLFTQNKVAFLIKCTCLIRPVHTAGD